MVQALVQIDDNTNRVLNIVKATYNLSDKGEAIAFVVGRYIEEVDEPELKPEFINKIKPSSRGQLEITDINNIYVQKKKLNWAELNGYWCDCGTFQSLFEANHYWAAKRIPHSA